MAYGSDFQAQFTKYTYLGLPLCWLLCGGIDVPHVLQLSLRLTARVEDLGELATMKLDGKIALVLNNSYWPSLFLFLWKPYLAPAQE